MMHYWTRTVTRIGVAATTLFCAAQIACVGSHAWIEAKPDQVAYVWKKAWGLSSDAGFKGAFQGPYRDHFLAHQNRKAIQITKAWAMRSELVPVQTTDGVSINFRAHVVTRPRVAPEYSNWKKNTQDLVAAYGIDKMKITNNDTPEGRSHWYDRAIRNTFRQYIIEEVGQYETLDVVVNARLIGNAVSCRLRNYLAGNAENKEAYDVSKQSCTLPEDDNSLFDVLTVDVGQISLPQAIRDSVVREVERRYEVEIAEVDVQLEEVKAEVRALQAQQATVLAETVDPELTELTITYERLRVFQSMTCNANTTIVIYTDINGLPIVDDIEVTTDEG